jgi:hypothetical protein
MKRMYFAVNVVEGESGEPMLDFDLVYGPPLVLSGIEGEAVIGSTVVLWVSPAGLSEDLAADLEAHWMEKFTLLGVKEVEAEAAPTPISRKAKLPVKRESGENDAAYLDKVLKVTRKNKPLKIVE